MPKTATRKGVVEGQVTPAAPDWEKIERAFRAGVLSIREIAKANGTSHTLINKRAKAGGWQRDLTAKVQKAVATKLVSTSVSSGNARTKVETERQIVEEAAETAVGIVRLHRRDARTAQALMDTLLAQLIGVAGNRDDIIADIYADTAYADAAGKGVDAVERQREQARRNAMLKAVALPTNIVALRDAATAMAKLVGIERQAYSIVGAPEPPPEADEATEVRDEHLAAFESKLAAVIGAAAPVT